MSDAPWTTQGALTRRIIRVRWPLRIRLFPEPASSLHVTVRVSATVKAMRRDARACGATLGSRERVWGLSHNFTRIRILPCGRQRKRPQFGNVFLSATGLTPEIVTHELAHATFAWAARVGIHVDEVHPFTDEERWCYAHGRMVADLTRRLERVGLM